MFIVVNFQTCTCRSQHASTQSCSSKGLAHPPCLFCLSFLVLFCSSSPLSLFLLLFSLSFFFPSLLCLLVCLSLFFLFAFFPLLLVVLLVGVCRSFDSSLVCVHRIHEFSLPPHRRFVDVPFYPLQRCSVFAFPCCDIHSACKCTGAAQVGASSIPS